MMIFFSKKSLNPIEYMFNKVKGELKKKEIKYFTNDDFFFAKKKSSQ